jgi:O-antigen ligase
MTGNPNSLAIFMGFAIVCTLYLLYEVKVAQRRLLFGTLILFSGILLLTYSRGTWIALVVGLIIFILLARKWSIISPVVIAALLGFILVYTPVNYGVQFVKSLDLDIEHRGEDLGGTIGGRLGELTSEENIDLMVESGRIFYIKKGFEVFKDYPVLGSGFGTFGDSATLSYGSPIYQNYGIRSDIYGGKNFYSDNQYIQVIAETGAMGILSFAVFLLGLLLMFWNRRKEKVFLSNFMIALWFSTGVMGLFYNIWELKLFTLFYFIILGAFTVKQRKGKTSTL